MSEFLEIEQKFDVDAGFERPSFGGLAGVSAAEPVLHHLSATYYDTEDQRLAASKITLRRRTGGSDAGWHLKLPEGAGERREVHAPLGTAEREVPEELAALERGVLVRHLDLDLQRAAADVLLAAGAQPAGHASKLARVLDS